MQAVELGPDDATDLCRLYDDYEWWTDRSPDAVARALAGSLGVGLRADGDLVASARVVTDYTYYATVYDVIVAADRRGEGVGRELMGAVVDHPALADLNLELTAREGLAGFYEACGFEEYDVTTDVAGEEEPFLRMAYWRERPDP